MWNPSLLHNSPRQSPSWKAHCCALLKQLPPRSSSSSSRFSKPQLPPSPQTARKRETGSQEEGGLLSRSWWPGWWQDVVWVLDADDPEPSGSCQSWVLQELTKPSFQLNSIYASNQTLAWESWRGSCVTLQDDVTHTRTDLQVKLDLK